MHRSSPPPDPVAASSQAKIPWPLQSFVALDLETTGLDSDHDRIIEVGWVRFEGGRAVSQQSQLIHPGRGVPREVTAITGLHDGDLVGAPAFAALLPLLAEELAAAGFLVAYNAAFDRPFLGRAFAREGRALPPVPWVDPFVLVRELEPPGVSMKLSEAAVRWGIRNDRPHRAAPDAFVAGELLLRAAPHLGEGSLDELLRLQRRCRDRQIERERAAAAAAAAPVREPAPASTSA